ncbi:MAG TPA: DUF192 domain-containing protein [Candidatus Elarobacter sp.]
MRATIRTRPTKDEPRLRALLLAAAALVALSAQASAPAGAEAAAPWCTAIPLPMGARASACRPLEIRTPRGSLRLAVAANERQREHGLMNVRWVPPGQGMIFAFPDGDQMRGFWMKDTVTPLDMVFVTSDGTISEVAVNVPATPPRTPDEKIARRQAVAHYVIELGSGQAGAFGLIPGSRIAVPVVAAQ